MLNKFLYYEGLRIISKDKQEPGHMEMVSMFTFKLSLPTGTISHEMVSIFRPSSILVGVGQS